MGKAITHNSDFAAALYHVLMSERRCTQTALGKAVGYQQSTISALMLGEREGIESKRRKIAAFFNFEYQDFLDLGKSIIAKQNENKANSINLEDNVNICNIQDEAIKRHQVVIEGFEDREWAIAVNQMLVEIEKRGTPELKALAKGAIENILNILPDTKKGLLNGTKDVK